MNGNINHPFVSGWDSPEILKLNSNLHCANNTNRPYHIIQQNRCLSENKHIPGCILFVVLPADNYLHL